MQDLKIDAINTLQYSKDTNKSSEKCVKFFIYRTRKEELIVSHYVTSMTPDHQNRCFRNIDDVNQWRSDIKGGDIQSLWSRATSATRKVGQYIDVKWVLSIVRKRHVKQAVDFVE